VNREECSVRLRLADEYSRLVTEFNALLDVLKVRSHPISDVVWNAAEAARTSSQKAWEALERHIVEHGCTDSLPASPGPDLGVLREMNEEES